ncbi:MAG: mechanosensitive ion channel family protein [Armatimonadetes bacterium]|nr:mechanosensitive ion channel family protein [Armatimonadota bacterium]MDW8027512.1 mechanosensitive ion channel [Armatimonadota bacterium]
MPPELQFLLMNALGWLRFWLLPRLWSVAIIAFVAYLLIRWLDGRWYSWLRPILLSSRERSPSQSVWRQVRILALPRTLTRIVVWIITFWLILERFGVPREIILWGLTIVVISVLWSIRHLISDLTSGYSLILDDAIVEGDQISSAFGEGIVERVSWFAVHLRASNGTQIIVPHRAITGNIIKVRRTSTKKPIG